MGRHTEEMEEQPRRRRKKKKRFGYYLYAFLMLVLTIANITIATFLLTYVQRIEVEGNKLSTDTQVVEVLKEDPFTMNSIYAVLKGKLGYYQVPVYLKELKVGWDRPWALHVKVTEKVVVAGIWQDGNYIYFTEDGTILQKSSEKIEDILVVEDVKTKEAVVYEKLELKDEKQFSYILSLAQELKKQELAPDRIVWEEDSMNLYFEEICVQLGKLNYDEKVLQIPPILDELAGKRGILHLEHYNEMSTSISFEEKNEI